MRPNFSPGVAAALRRRRQGQGAQGGRADQRYLQRACRPSSAARTSTTSAASADSGASFSRPSRASGPRARTSGSSTCETGAARWCRSRRSCNCKLRAARSTPCASTCTGPSRSSGTQAAGYSSGQALAALEDVAAKTLPPEMGYAWNALSYQEKVASGGAARVLGLSLVVRVPHPRRALRELVAAVQRPSEHAGRGARRLRRASGRATSTTTSTPRSGS